MKKQGILCFLWTLEHSGLVFEYLPLGPSFATSQEDWIHEETRDPMFPWDLEQIGLVFEYLSLSPYIAASQEDWIHEETRDPMFPRDVGAEWAGL